jgi:hypothetical protein
MMTPQEATELTTSEADKLRKSLKQALEFIEDLKIERDKAMLQLQITIKIANKHIDRITELEEEVEDLKKQVAHVP